MPLFTGMSKKTEKPIKSRKPQKITKNWTVKKPIKKTKPNPNQAKLKKPSQTETAEPNQKT